MEQISNVKLQKMYDDFSEASKTIHMCCRGTVKVLTDKGFIPVKSIADHTSIKPRLPGIKPNLNIIGMDVKIGSGPHFFSYVPRCADSPKRERIATIAFE